jgi:putative oxidoreductase
MKNITTAGRFLFAIPFAIFGLNHFLMVDYYLGMLTSFIPFGAYTIVLTGLLLIGISISIMTRWYIKQAAYTLAALLLIFILAIHVPHLFQLMTVPWPLLPCLRTPLSWEDR